MVAETHWQTRRPTERLDPVGAVLARQRGLLELKTLRPPAQRVEAVPLTLMAAGA